LRRPSFAGALSLLLGIGLVFCGCAERDAGAPVWSPGVPIEKRHIKIGVIYRTDPLTSANRCDYAHYAGILEMQRALDLGEEQLIHKGNVPGMDLAALDYAVRECVAQGANIIVATSFGYMDAIADLAEEFPHVVFVHVSGDRRNDTNCASYFGRAYQARYLSGIVAGLKTRTNKIGYVAAMSRENSEVTRGLNAFALGIESVNPLARVYVTLTTGWYDPDGETRAARRLIAGGCDVIGQHSDTANPQIEAGKSGVWGVGYHDDMEDEAPRAVLTSVRWNWDVYYLKLVRSVMDGSFTTEPYFGGMGEGIVDLAPLNERTVAPGTADIIARAQDQILKGGFDVFYGEMRTNDGRIVGERGRYLSTEEILEGSDWYYHTIESVD
jgi:basic membrane protein A